MATKVLTIQTQKDPILRVTDTVLSVKNLVYIAKANKKIHYRFNASSRIAYIGETTTGIDRIASSAAERSREILSLNGFKHLDFFIIQCKGKQKVRTWEILERDLLLVFRSMFGEVPKGNVQGQKLPPGLSGYFRRERLEEIIRVNSQ